MARTVRDAKLESPTARAKLKISYVPYWRAIDPGLHIGYRRGRNGGQWVARRHLGKGSRKDYESETLPGIADDRQPADGGQVLNFAQAQKKVREWFSERVSPANPSGPLLVREACARYVAYLKADKRTGADAEQRLARHVLPRLGHRPVAALTTGELEACKRAMVKQDPKDPEVERRSKDTANRTFTSLRGALNQAFRDTSNAIPTDSAWRRVKPFSDVGRAREIFLDQQQAGELVDAATGAFRTLVTAALLTGARPPHELANVRVRDFDAENATLTITGGKTGRRIVTLTTEAIGFFEDIASEREPDAILLPKEDGTSWGRNHHVRPMREAVKKAKLPSDCTIYALRHTHASQALLNGINLKLLAENLGTSVGMIEKHYGKFLAASRRQLIEESGFKLGLTRGDGRSASGIG